MPEALRPGDIDPAKALALFQENERLKAANADLLAALKRARNALRYGQTEFEERLYQDGTGFNNLSYQGQAYIVANEAVKKAGGT